MRERSTAEWLRILTEADVPNGPVNGLADLLDNAYLAAGGFFREVEHPTEGRTTVINNPVVFSDTPNAVWRLPPKLGADSDMVLGDVVLGDGVLGDVVEGGQ